MIGLLIILALVTVPLVLIARLSFTVLARMLGVVSQSEVATRAEFARIREQLQARAGEDDASPREGGTLVHQNALEVSSNGLRERPPIAGSTPVGLTSAGPTPAADAATESVDTADVTVSAGPADGTDPEPDASLPPTPQWCACPVCAASAPSTALICLQCGAALVSSPRR